MLVQFSVENYRSVKDVCELSMVASRYYKENEQENTFETGIADCPRLLKSVVIYGPNGAGKTTLLEAMKFVESFVLNSAPKSQAGEEIDVTPFRLSKDTRNKSSNFEIIFIEDGVRYEYGLCATKERVTEEWLIAFPKGVPQKWFHRIYDPETAAYAYKYSKYFEGGRMRGGWQKQTRQNASYLSTAIQLNNEQLTPVYNWFFRRLATLRPDGLSSEFTAESCLDSEFKKSVLEFISSADIPLSNIEVETLKYMDMKFPDHIPTVFKEEITKSLKDKEYHEVSFVRTDDAGEAVRFKLAEESKGTQGLFNFAGPWIDVISNNLVLFVDELDSSLHPLIVHHLVDILHKSGSNAQIIFTTHDTTILSQKILRRDQVWLLKKNKFHASELYPLSDYKIRDGEAIEKGYLSGRYGAVPFIKDMNFNGI
ncbi:MULTISPECIES: AAA family ATPase [unclassified Pseudomonas]|jgi:AAA15 family ATPase/GTPase|uniref:AAA family ATPase n=1 Tax=unclassified Pseudomonas TaxID=196821 RepID=UPI000FA47501|nr:MULTISPECIES: ATP-binding protein [unclassified Pseudomonas]